MKAAVMRAQNAPLEIEELNTAIGASRETINSQIKQLNQVQVELEQMKKKKKQYHSLSDKYSKMNQRLEQEKA